MPHFTDNFRSNYQDKTGRAEGQNKTKARTENINIIHRENLYTGKEAQRIELS